MKKSVFSALVAVMFLATGCFGSSYTQTYSVGIVEGISKYHFNTNISLNKVKNYFKDKGFESTMTISGTSQYDCDVAAYNKFRELMKSVSVEEISQQCQLEENEYFEYVLVSYDGFNPLVLDYFSYNVPVDPDKIEQ